jgi:mannose-1-phosphate guanylyltransferase
MKAILLAAGLGTRLRPLTNEIPKCLVPIGGDPLLGLWIDKLVQSGVEEILINTHYRCDQVSAYLLQHPHRRKITLVHEPDLLGTGGTLVRNQGFWKNQSCWVIHADNFYPGPLAPMSHLHERAPRGICATLMLFRTDAPQCCGIVTLGKDNRISGFYEKVETPPGNLASGAVFLFSPPVYDLFFADFVEGEFLDLSKTVLPQMVGAMQGWVTQDHFIDVGTPENYERAQSLAQLERVE